MSEDLKNFLQEWLEWAEGRNEKAQFSAGAGLCHNYFKWCLAEKVPNLSSRKHEVTDILVKDGLDQHYPFGGFHTYDNERFWKTMHKNPERLAWVRKQLMHEQLRLFCKAWLEWAESGHTEAHQIFTQRAGLCSNFDFWLEVNNPVLQGSADSFLKLLFKEEGLDGQHPFGGPDLYIDECLMWEVHKNPERLAWVRKQLCTNS